jgi:hypothetical protein
MITDVNFSIKSNVALKWLSRKGFQFTAARSVPSESGEMVATGPKKSDKIEPYREKALTKETAEPEQRTPAETQKKVDISPKKQEKISQPPKVEPKPEKKFVAKGPGAGKILTEKKPYNMDELIEGMQEMEDMMEEMKDMIDDFKKRRKR